MKTGRGRGFNAAQKGSGQVGFQSAPPVHPEVPSAIDWAEELLELQEEESQDSDSLDTVYAQYSTLIQRNMDASLEGLSEEEKDIVLAARSRIESDNNSEVFLTPETRYAAQGLLKELGFTPEEEKNILEQFSPADIPKQVNYYEYMPSEDAEYELRELIQGPPFYALTKAEEEESVLLSKVRSGEIMLTRHDLDYLTGLRNHAHTVFLESRSLEERRMLEAEWISASVNRKCELCGQFVSTRDSHGELSSFALRSLDGETGPTSLEYGCKGGYTKELNNLKQYINKREYLNARSNDSQLKTIDIVSSEDIVEGSVPLKETWLPKTDKTFVFEEIECSEEYLEDAYMASRELRPSIISLYVEKGSLFGRDKKIILPQNIREALVEAPVVKSRLLYGEEEEVLEVNSMVVNVAARIDPPLSREEVKRMIDRGDRGVLLALLSVKRTRELASSIIVDYPSQALRSLSTTRRGLSHDIVAEMVSSGDPRVRAYAAGSPILTLDDAMRLAEDPNPMVRRALIVPHIDDIVPGEQLEALARYNSALSRYKENLAEILINDAEPEIAFTAFRGMSPIKHTKSEWTAEWGTAITVSYRFSQEQKYLISKIRSRKRFNELKQHVIGVGYYSLKDPEVERFLAH